MSGRAVDSGGTGLDETRGWDPGGTGGRRTEWGDSGGTGEGGPSGVTRVVGLGGARGRSGTGETQVRRVGMDQVGGWDHWGVRVSGLQHRAQKLLLWRQILHTVFCGGSEGGGAAVQFGLAGGAHGVERGRVAGHQLELADGLVQQQVEARRRRRRRPAGRPAPGGWARERRRRRRPGAGRAGPPRSSRPECRRHRPGRWRSAGQASAPGRSRRPAAGVRPATPRRSATASRLAGAGRVTDRPR